MNQNSATRVILASLLLLVLILPFVETASAQSISYFLRTVKLVTSSPVMHASVRQNFSIPFQAVWTYGSSLGQAIENANVTVEVKTGHGDSVENVTQTTNATGFATFNYSFSVPVILTFTPARTVTQDGTEWNASLFTTFNQNLLRFTVILSTYHW